MMSVLFATEVEVVLKDLGRLFRDDPFDDLAGSGELARGLGAFAPCGRGCSVRLGV
jgi:hypothetical protein